MFSILSITSCSKDTSPEEESQQSIAGNWEVNKVVRIDSKTEVKEEVKDLDIEYKTLDFDTNANVKISGYKLEEGKKIPYSTTTTYKMTSPYQYEIKTDKKINIFASLKFDGKNMEISESPGLQYTYIYYYTKK